MNEEIRDDFNHDLKRKVQSIILAHLYIKKNELQDKVSLQEIKEKVSLLDKSYLEPDLIKLWNNTDWVKIDDLNNFMITEEGMIEEERKIKDNKIID